jgi:Lrp/AsnC family leucine-responsive transcriptional regulator
MTRSSKHQIEQDEKKVLYELVKHAKENVDTIAHTCGFSRQKVWRMIKHLEKEKLIWGYTAVYNEQKIGQTHFIMMIKRTMEKIDERVIETIITTKSENLAKEFGITIETAAYIHGEYDWMLTFTAEDIAQAKRFSEQLIALYPSGTDKISLFQTLIFVRKNHLLNPERKNLKYFL